MKKKPTFKIGDQVTWSSQSRGVRTTKTGMVIARILTGRLPLKAIAKLADRYTSRYGGGMSRDHVSYLVGVDGQNGRKPELYWPLVTVLELVSARPKAARKAA
jgi:hypothetical protein